MFSIDNLIASNKSSVKELVEKQPMTADMEKIKKTFEMIKSECAGNEELEDYYEELESRCYEYTDIVCGFNQLFQDHEDGRISGDEYRSALQALDSDRVRVHDATIDSFNILSRLMAKYKKNNDWIEPLANGGRVAYGSHALKKTTIDVLEYYKQKGGRHD